MRILYPVPEILPDPRARFIQIVNTCCALAETGNSVVLLAGMNPGCTAEDVCRYYGVRNHPNLEIVRMPILRREHAAFPRFSWHGVFHWPLLFRILRESFSGGERPVLYMRHIKLAEFLLRTRRIAGIPVVFEMHEIFHLSTVNERKREEIRRREIRVYGEADAVVTLSEKLKDHLAEMKIPRSGVFVVPHGVRKEWFDVEWKPPGSYICYVGSLYRWKGVDTLITAMKFLPGQELVVVGGGERLAELEKTAERENVADRVRFAGAVPHADVPGFLAGAKVCVLPNIAEGPTEFAFPLKLLEYMAAGVPTVASDIPIYTELVRDGREAILVGAGNPESLASGIRKVVEHPRLAEEMSAASRRTAEGFTYAMRAGRIADVLKSLPGVSR
jgi:glycosyltransferase involved in cell wall biosynthesis